MINDKKIGVAIPCYMGGTTAIDVVKETIKYADLVVLVDDDCPLGTGRKLESKIDSDKYEYTIP